MRKSVDKVRCEDYVECEGCPLKQIVKMDRYDENNNYIGEEEILFCERNGKINEVFEEGNIDDILDG